MALALSALLPPWSVFADAIEAQQQIDPAKAALVLGAVATRFAVMFLAGALLCQFRDVIPARWSLVAVSVVIVLASSLLPNYRLIGGDSADVRHHRFRCPHPQQALETADGSVLWGVHLRFSDSAVAGHLGAWQHESRCVRGHCSLRHRAASRVELVPGREAVHCL